MGTGALAGRRIVVTGASSGIGAATARAVADAGGQVALVARRQDRLRELAAELDGVAVAADVTDLPALESAVAHAAAELGGLDGIVTAAGLSRPGPIATADPADWRAMVEVNVLGTLHAIRAATPYLVAADHADVVTVSSMTGRRLKSPELAVYAATKAGVHALTEGVRQELAGDGVRVTVVAPGLVDTELLDGQDDATSRRLATSAREVGLSAADVADAIVHVLASPPHVVHVEVALLSLDQG